MKAYFSRLVPFYLIAPEDADDSIGFDAYPVDVDPRTVAVCQALRRLERQMDNVFDRMPAPEEKTQEEALIFEGLLEEIIYGEE